MCYNFSSDVLNYITNLIPDFSNFHCFDYDLLRVYDPSLNVYDPTIYVKLMDFFFSEHYSSDNYFNYSCPVDSNYELYVSLSSPKFYIIRHSYGYSSMLPF